MGPKKKDGGKAVPGEAVEGEDPIVFLQNYQKFCKSIGILPNGSVAKICNDVDHYPVDQLIIDDDFGAIGPGGARALLASVMGSGAGMKGGPYKLLKSIRIWRSNIGDDGAAAMAELLRLGGADVQINYLELFDNNIGERGGLALGASLSHGHNLSLLTLKLDHNGTLGSGGIINLCKGLRSNVTMKQLHVEFCQITHEAGPALADLLKNERSVLEVLNLSGNRLGGVGLAALCRGLSVNTACKKLLLADNMIDQSDDDFHGITCLKDCLLKPTLGLTHIDLMYNRIGQEGAAILAEALTPENKKVLEFLVDLTIPLPSFEQIFRRDAGGKAKKGKKGKKK